MAGVLGCVSAMIAMIVMYPGSVARFDLFSTIDFLAKRITRWGRECDRRLHRLMCYGMTTADEVSYGWIGDDLAELTPHLFADANFAGCPYTLTSTNGVASTYRDLVFGFQSPQAVPYIRALPKAVPNPKSFH